MTAPLAIDLYCGLGGWTSALLDAGYDVIGFDIERHVYGEHRYPAQLVVQDARTLHGRQFKDAALIVASPPCQFFSYTAMPWSRAKAIAADVRADPARLAKELELFETCFRLQREASEAAGHHIPLVVENVRGAQPWVGKAAWNFGSFYLWGDVPALMPMTSKRQKFNPDGTAHGVGSWFAVADSKNRGFRQIHAAWRAKHYDETAKMQQAESDGVKQGGDWFNAAALDGNGQQSVSRRSGSKSSARKAASARIAKIPAALARHIALTYLPLEADNNYERGPSSDNG